MSMINILEEALESVNEAYHAFLLRYKKNSRTVYGFVEGKEDPMFYRSVIERFLPDDWEVDLIASGGKRYVLEIAEGMNWDSFSQKQIAFFVDRDLTHYVRDVEIRHENVYVTDGYSIENSVVSSRVFRRLLLETHNVVDASDDEMDAMEKKFEIELNKFQVFLIPIMAQILLWRRSKTNANLNNLKLNPMFKFVGGSIELLEKYSDVNDRVEHLAYCVGAPKSDIDEVLLSADEFCKNSGERKYVRGKYVIWMLSNYVSHIHSIVHEFVKAYNRPPKINMPSGPANVMVVAAPRAIIPESLKAFIETTFLAYVGSPKVG